MQANESHHEKGKEQVPRTQQEHIPRHALRQQVLQKRDDSHKILMWQNHLDSDEEPLHEEETEQLATVDDLDKENQDRGEEEGSVQFLTLFVGRNNKKRMRWPKTGARKESQPTFRQRIQPS